MARTSKEQRIYLDGMAFAYKIAKENGIEALETEMRVRNLKDLPLNIEYGRVILYCRGEAHNELMLVATASAAALSMDLKLPPTMAVEYLKAFNGRVDMYHSDPVRYEKDMVSLNRDLGMSSIMARYSQEVKNDGTK